jgi:DeoR/GlpR family transcriptional regulator of sugar metabolism
VRDGDLLVLESGSTCVAVVPCLAERSNLRVVSVSLRILAALAELAGAGAPNLEIISSGGTLNVYRDFLMGPQARALFEDLHVDLALHSVTAIDLEAGITADSIGEAEITRTILTRSARRRIGLIVSSKFQTASFVRVAPVEAFDEIITDAGLDPAVGERYRRRGILLTEV